MGSLKLLLVFGLLLGVADGNPTAGQVGGSCDAGSPCTDDNAACSAADSGTCVCSAGYQDSGNPDYTCVVSPGIACTADGVACAAGHTCDTTCKANTDSACDADATPPVMCVDDNTCTDKKCVKNTAALSGVSSVALLVTAILTLLRLF